MEITVALWRPRVGRSEKKKKIFSLFLILRAFKKNLRTIFFGSLFNLPYITIVFFQSMNQNIEPFKVKLVTVVFFYY